MSPGSPVERPSVCPDRPAAPAIRSTGYGSAPVRQPTSSGNPAALHSAGSSSRSLEPERPPLSEHLPTRQARVPAWVELYVALSVALPAWPEQVWQLLEPAGQELVCWRHSRSAASAPVVLPPGPPTTPAPVPWHTTPPTSIDWR